MTLTELIKSSPKARERRYKNLAIGYILRQRFPFMRDASLDDIATIVREAITLDREWRKIMQDNPSLRGSDYDEKTVLEQKSELALGYQPGAEQMKKKLQTLF